MDDWQYKDDDLGLGNDFSLDVLGSDPVLNGFNFQFPGGGMNASMGIGTPTSLERSLGSLGIPEMPQPENQTMRDSQTTRPGAGAPDGTGNAGNVSSQQTDSQNQGGSQPPAQQAQQQSSKQGQGQSKSEGGQDHQRPPQQPQSSQQSGQMGMGQSQGPKPEQAAGQGPSTATSTQSSSNSHTSAASQPSMDPLAGLSTQPNNSAALSYGNSLGLNTSVDIFTASGLGASGSGSSNSTASTPFASGTRPHLQNPGASSMAALNALGLDDSLSNSLYGNVVGVPMSPNILQNPLLGSQGLSYSPTADIFAAQLNQPIPPPPDIFSGQGLGLGALGLSQSQSLVGVPQYAQLNQAAALYNQVAGLASQQALAQFGQQPSASIPASLAANPQYQALLQQRRAQVAAAAAAQARGGMSNQNVAQQLMAAQVNSLTQNQLLARQAALQQQQNANAQNSGGMSQAGGQSHGQTAPATAWQSDNDINYRRQMIAKIVSLLQRRKPDAPQDWLKKLPDIARRLEDSLYRTASSLEEYVDFTTLKKRLQDLAIRMGARAAAAKPSAGGGMSTQPSVPGSGGPTVPAGAKLTPQVMSQMMAAAAHSRGLNVPLAGTPSIPTTGTLNQSGLTPMQQQQLQQLYAQQGLVMNQGGLPLSVLQQQALRARAQAQVQAQAQAQAQAARAQAQAQAAAQAQAQAQARAAQAQAHAQVQAQQQPQQQRPSQNGPPGSGAQAQKQVQNKPAAGVVPPNQQQTAAQAQAQAQAVARARAAVAAAGQSASQNAQLPGGKTAPAQVGGSASASGNTPPKAPNPASGGAQSGANVPAKGAGRGRGNGATGAAANKTPRGPAAAKSGGPVASPGAKRNPRAKSPRNGTKASPPAAARPVKKARTESGGRPGTGGNASAATSAQL